MQQIQLIDARLVSWENDQHVQLLRLYGRTLTGKAVTVDVKDTQCYFYLKGRQAGAALNKLFEKTRNVYRWNKRSCSKKQAFEWVTSDGKRVTMCPQWNCKPCRQEQRRVDQRCDNCRQEGTLCNTCRKAEQPRFEPRDFPCIRHQEPFFDGLVRSKEKDSDCVVNRRNVTVEPVEMRSLLGYKRDPEKYLKVTIPRFFLLPSIKRRALQLSEEWGFSLAEAHIDPLRRIMTDTGLVGCGWFECPQQKEVSVGDLRALPDVTENAPLRILAFDIECMAEGDNFPTAKKDSVIQISCVTAIYPHTGVTRSFLFVLDTCDSLGPDVDVRCFETEKALLEAWFAFMTTEFDADILTGYNSNQFDIPYLFDRADVLGADIRNSSKDPNVPYSRYHQIFDSAQTGQLEWVRNNLPGRVCLDVFELVKKTLKLRSYKLNSVAKEVLHDEKEDVHYSEIKALQKGDATTRKRLATYCLKDSVLVMQLIDHLQLLTNQIELARVIGILLKYVWIKGQTYRVEKMIMQKTRERGYVIPTFPRKDGKTHVSAYATLYESLNKRLLQPERQQDPPPFIGATVIEPSCGFYCTHPIATLDFASLYPSIMMRHNLSFDMLLWNKEGAKRQGLTTDEYAITPNGFLFVKRDKRVGILPQLLQEVLAARKRAKNAMRYATTSSTKATHNARQLALKCCANSVYGYCGSSTNSIPCLAVSSSVTAFGRKMIQDSKTSVETMFPGCKVLYGDTDSIMVQFPTTTVPDCIRMAKEAERRLNAELFVRPVFLEYEKVFFPFLLLKKKKYAANKFETITDKGTLDAKGIELARRDNCLYVRKVQRAVLVALLENNDHVEAMHIFTKAIENLMQQRVPLEDLIISKALKKWTYKNPQPHSELANKMRRRTPNDPPKLGDRIPYIIIATGGNKVCHRAEEPSRVSVRDIDYSYYLHHQLSKPFIRIFDQVIGPLETKRLFSGPHMTPKDSAGLHASNKCPKGRERVRNVPLIQVNTTHSVHRKTANTWLSRVPNPTRSRRVDIKRKRGETQGVKCPTTKKQKKQKNEYITHFFSK
jgi:DNA polymerase delta subunit 1